MVNIYFTYYHISGQWLVNLNWSLATDMLMVKFNTKDDIYRYISNYLLDLLNPFVNLLIKITTYPLTYFSHIFGYIL